MRLAHLARFLFCLSWAVAVAVTPRDAGADSDTPRRKSGQIVPPTPEVVPEDPPVSAPEAPTGFTLWKHPTRLPPDPAIELPDRWRIGWPNYDRYPTAPHEAPQVRGTWWDPYKQNVLKGDYPILGENTFLIATLRSDTLLEARRVPTPSDVSPDRSNSVSFFGEGESLTFEQNFLLSFEAFSGNAGFRPRRWELKVSPVFNFNNLAAREHGVVNIDPRRETSRFDGHVAFQELFGDYELAEVGPFFDTVNVRGGIQTFISDFRGFLFTDSAPGLRFFGNYHANRTQWSLAYFRPLDKDTNTQLNTLFRDRQQNVAIANLLRQDLIWPGYFAQLSLHYLHDGATDFHFDENGFLVRPAAVGDAAPHEIHVGYLGWAGDGHIDRIGISHAFFHAIGHDTRNPIAGRATDISASMAALELSYERDWLLFKGSVFWASGDKDPTDGRATGFDAIFDNPIFAGGPASFWQRQRVKLSGTNVNLVDRFSLLPTLRSSKAEGQPNFVNPGIFIYTVGVFGRLTPKLAFEVNASYLRFQEVDPLRVVLLQNDIPHDVGVDYGIVFRYRPLLIENVALVAGVAGFSPLPGFRNIFESKTLYQLFTALTLTY